MPPTLAMAHELVEQRGAESGRDLKDLEVEPLSHGCEDQWTWSRRERSPEVRLYGPGLRTAHFHPHWSSGTAGVRGQRVLNNGCYFWELQVSQRIFGTSMMFGIGTRRARLHADAFTNLLGEDEHGWGLSHKGLLWHAGRWHHYTRPFRENQRTTVGILFDGIAGTLTFYKDGKCLGVAFRGLQEIREPLYPIVCSTAAKTEMTLTSMRRTFVNLQDRCRAVIVKRITGRRQLDDLQVPPRIRSFLAEAMHLQQQQPQSHNQLQQHQQQQQSLGNVNKYVLNLLHSV